VGALTSFMAATIGLLQNDLKRIIAYSTASQLGYIQIMLNKIRKLTCNLILILFFIIFSPVGSFLFDLLFLAAFLYNWGFLCVFNEINNSQILSNLVQIFCFSTTACNSYPSNNSEPPKDGVMNQEDSTIESENLENLIPSNIKDILPESHEYVYKFSGSTEPYQYNIKAQYRYTPCIYLWYNTITQRSYVGKTTNFWYRMQSYFYPPPPVGGGDFMSSKATK
jgi:hypothetical protein